MDYGDCYWGLYRDSRKDPFPDSLLSTRQSTISTRAGSSGALISLSQQVLKPGLSWEITQHKELQC